MKPSATVWEPRYRSLVIATDLASTVGVVVVLGALMQNGYPGWRFWTVAGMSTVTVAAVVGSFALAHAWHGKFLGQGAEEFGSLGRGLAGALVGLALIILAAGPEGGRFWVFTVVPAIAAVLFPQRYLLRKRLHYERSQGRCLLPVLAAGDSGSVRDLIDRARAAPHLGWRVEAVCTMGGAEDGASDLGGVPVIGSLDDIAERVRNGGYRIVAVNPHQAWTPARLQRLSWDLEGTGAEMVVAPGLMEIAGPRLHVSGVLGMPMLWVSQPVFTGFPKVIKGVVDRVGAAVLLIALCPVLLGVAVLITISGRGPVLYRQRRVGKDGAEFVIAKFRTMVTGAERMREELDDTHDGAGPLFKLRGDPRVTRVGAVLRRYSIDELPQLVNVLRGQMSLVGPRPPLPAETECYEPHVRRKLLVKPGVTGLWQVSGRSDLSWEESVRLDLRYVEDWSLALDFMILWKTLRAVLGGRGAY